MNIRYRLTPRISTILTLSGLLAAAASAQDAVGRLHDLVGARAGQAESELEGRGYSHVGAEQSGDAVYGYWREASSNRCVSVRTAQGRYDAIVYVPDADCQRVGKGQAHAAAPEGSFASVCGVVSEGREYRYRCHVRTDGCHGEGHCRTIVTYPDMELRITWHKDNHGTVEVEGLQPQEVTSTFDQGLTKFTFYDKPYFFYGSKERAEKEAAKFHE